MKEMSQKCKEEGDQLPLPPEVSKRALMARVAHDSLDANIRGEG